jgi:hypothetical protein
VVGQTVNEQRLAQAWRLAGLATLAQSATQAPRSAPQSTALAG